MLYTSLIYNIYCILTSLFLLLYISYIWKGRHDQKVYPSGTVLYRSTLVIPVKHFRHVD